MYAECHIVTFVNVMRSSRFYWINTKIIYKLTALLQFTYDIHTDLPM